MLHKQQLLTFFTIVLCNIPLTAHETYVTEALDGEEYITEEFLAGEILESNLEQCSFIRYWCKQECTKDCVFIAHHIEKANKLLHEKHHIANLKDQLSRVDVPILKTPIEQDLKNAQALCPNADKTHWEAIGPKEQEQIVGAVSNLVRTHQREDVYAAQLNAIYAVLNK